MKLKTSFFNPAVFKKDVTRFAPSWGLYSVFLVICLVTMLDRPDFWAASDIAAVIGATAVPMMVYALITAVLLFGDLYQSRLCNALHALPLRRECWFVTHVAAGFAFMMVPSLIAALIGCAALGAGWSVALWWLLGAVLEYVFFFGLAVICVFFAGNRVAAVLIYGMFNGLALIFYWFLKFLYEPLLYGVRFNFEDIIVLFCPVGQMASSTELLNVVKVPESSVLSMNPSSLYQDTEPFIDRIAVGTGWGYLAICAGVGILLLAGALLLYRRRNLETAGDFVAFRPIAPVFLVVYSLTVGMLIHAFLTIFTDFQLFIYLGVAVGFFTGLMLLHRTTRVFRKKALIGFAVLMVLLAGSRQLTRWDVMGISTRIPYVSQIQSVSLNGDGIYMELEEPEEFQDVITIHRSGIDSNPRRTAVDMEDLPTTDLFIRYEMQNGTTICRNYPIAVRSTAGDLLREYASRPEAVFGTDRLDPAYLAASIRNLYIYPDERDVYFVGEDPLENAAGLIDALLLDCEEGTAIQSWAYHRDDLSIGYLGLEYHSGGSGHVRYNDLGLYESMENTVAWLTENGYYTPDMNS